MSDDRAPLSIRKHGIDFPEWMWKMVGICRKYQAMGSRTEWLRRAIINQAKKDGVYDRIKEEIFKNVNLEVVE